MGVRVLGFEVASVDELDQVQERLTERHAYGGRRQQDTWEVVLGLDPDQCEFVVVRSLTGRPSQIADWTYLDEAIEAIGQ